jgi:asparagine synthetase B (glutamine-hydrolysing)
MCGISGYISFTSEPAHFIGEMTDLIRHRGPDDEGYCLRIYLLSLLFVVGKTLMIKLILRV